MAEQPSRLAIEVGPHRFTARLEWDRAPETCRRFCALLPFRNKVIHSRWSGEAVWIPLGDFDTGLGFENHTAHPSRGDVLLYPGGVSETELLIPYGPTRFASKAGVLAGNHFLTVTSGAEHLPELGRLTLWRGAQPIRIDQP